MITAILYLAEVYLQQNLSAWVYVLPVITDIVIIARIAPKE